MTKSDVENYDINTFLNDRLRSHSHSYSLEGKKVYLNYMTGFYGRVLVSVDSGNLSQFNSLSSEDQMFLCFTYDRIPLLKSSEYDDCRMHYYLISGWEESALSDCNEDIRFLARNHFNNWDPSTFDGEESYEIRLNILAKSGSFEDMAKSPYLCLSTYASYRGYYIDESVPFADPLMSELSEKSTMCEEVLDKIFSQASDLESHTKSFIDNHYPTTTATGSSDSRFIQDAYQDAYKKRILEVETLLNLKPSLDRNLNANTELAYYRKFGFEESSKDSDHLEVVIEATMHLGYKPEDIHKDPLRLKAARIFGNYDDYLKSNEDYDVIGLYVSFGRDYDEIKTEKNIIDRLRICNDYASGHWDKVNDVLESIKSGEKVVPVDSDKRQEFIRSILDEEDADVYEAYTASLEDLPMLQIKQPDIVNKRLELGI
jgi:hypothetical protein